MKERLCLKQENKIEDAPLIEILTGSHLEVSFLDLDEGADDVINYINSEVISSEIEFTELTLLYKKL